MLFTYRNPQTQLDEERTALVAAGVQNGFLKPGASTHDELIETPSWSRPVPAGARFDSSRLGCSSRVRWRTLRAIGCVGVNRSSAGATDMRQANV